MKTPRYLVTLQAYTIFLTLCSNMETEKEKPELSPINLDVDEGLTRAYETHCLIGKILLHRPVDETLVASFTQTEWSCKMGITVSQISRNVFLFVFKEKEDLANVLENRPWTIMGGLLLLAVCISGEVPHELKFIYSSFWVQAHGLPLDYLTMENGSKIGGLLGMYVCTDWQVYCGSISWRRFLRLRVVLDVTKPVKTGFWLKRPGLLDIWIDFKYEKLGAFCYKCGRIGRNFRHCKFPAGHGKFGPWLRADTPDHAKRRVVDSRADQNACPAVVAVPKAEGALVHFSSLEDVALNSPIMDFEQSPREAETIPGSNLWQRLIYNSLDSMIMITNCTVILSRVTSVDESENNCALLVVMATYLFHLFLKLVRVNRDLRFLKAPIEAIPPDDNSKAISEILVLILFLVALVSF